MHSALLCGTGRIVGLGPRVVVLVAALDGYGVIDGGSVAIFVGEAVGVAVPVDTAVNCAVDVPVAVRVNVIVTVRVCVGVLVAVSVLVGMSLGVDVVVGNSVGVAVSDGVRLGDGVGVSVGDGLAVGDVMGVQAPAPRGSSRPILLPTGLCSVNHKAPSAPAAMLLGELFKVGIGNSMTIPAVEIR